MASFDPTRLRFSPFADQSTIYSSQPVVAGRTAGSIQISSSLNRAELFLLMVGLFHYPALFTQAQRKSIGYHFSSQEADLAFVWNVWSKLSKMNVDRQLWYDVVKLHVEELLKHFEKKSDDSSADDWSVTNIQSYFLKDLLGPEGFLAFWRSSLSSPPVPIQTVTELLQRFVNERIGLKAIQQLSLFSSAGSSGLSPVVSNLIQKIDEIKDLVRLSKSEALHKPAVLNQLPERRKSVPSSILWFDKICDGGLAIGEVGGILGFYKGGKTTLGLQLAQAYAQRELRLVREGVKKKPGWVYFFSYEMPLDRLREILHAQLAYIPMNRLRSLNSLDDLATSIGLEYELELGNLITACERDRFISANRLLAEELPLQLADMIQYKGEEKHRGVTDIIEIIDAEAADKEIVAIIVDHVAAMMRLSYVADQFLFRHAIVSLAAVCRQRLASRYNCVVWLFHQYSADANRRKMKSPDHTYAAEARGFGEGLDVCLCMTNLTELSDASVPKNLRGRYIRMLCPIMRYSKPPCDEVVLRFFEPMHQFVEADPHIVWNDIIGSFIYSGQIH